MTPLVACVGGHVYQEPPPWHMSCSDTPDLPYNQRTQLPHIPPCYECIYGRMWSQNWFPLTTPGYMSQSPILRCQEASSRTSVPLSVSTFRSAPSSPTSTTQPHYGDIKRTSPPPPPPPPIYSAPSDLMCSPAMRVSLRNYYSYIDRQVSLKVIILKLLGCC